jgi:hypothetical protein
MLIVGNPRMADRDLYSPLAEGCPKGGVSSLSFSISYEILPADFYEYPTPAFGHPSLRGISQCH